jgi:hypothetical protein
MPEIAGGVWWDVADEANESGPGNVVFFHRLAADLVHDHQSNNDSELKKKLLSVNGLTGR